MCKINPQTGERLSNIVHLCSGSGGRYAEAPHLYKKDGYYYLLMSEGGTEYGHMITIFRSASPFGPYEACSQNPILSHRNLGGHPIQCTGHGDIFDDQHGNYWIVRLGARPLGGRMLHHLGRETFLAPVTWNADEWPVIGNNGHIDITMDALLPAPVTAIDRNFYDDFFSCQIKPQWSFVRNPQVAQYDLLSKNSIVLRGTAVTLSDMQSPTLLLYRQPEFEMHAKTTVTLVNKGDHPQAGLTAFYNCDYHYEIYLTCENHKTYVCVNKKIHDIETVICMQELSNSQSVTLQITSDKENYYFSYSEDKEQFTQLATALTTGLCTETTHMCTFTGTFFGIYAIGVDAEFEYFSAKVK